MASKAKKSFRTFRGERRMLLQKIIHVCNQVASDNSRYTSEDSGDVNKPLLDNSYIVQFEGIKSAAIAALAQKTTVNYS